MHKLNAGLRYKTDIGLDMQVDLHVASSQGWSELTLTGSSLDAIRILDYELPAYYLVNARVSYRLMGDRLELGVTGYNITNNRHRQHPFGQLLGARVLGTVGVTL
jgi:outer membrane receptor protein involved in Fe transport